MVRPLAAETTDVFAIVGAPAYDTSESCIATAPPLHDAIEEQPQNDVFIPYPRADNPGFSAAAPANHVPIRSAAQRCAVYGSRDRHVMKRHPLLAPDRLFTRAEVLTRPSPAPAEPGVYAWYFRDAPPLVPVETVHQFEGHALLYVGISPSRPRSNGKPPSRQYLRKRLRYHFCGNA